jgi:MtfA peptidase
MTLTGWILLALAGAVAAIWFSPQLQQIQYRRIQARPFPQMQLALVRQYLPCYDQIEPDQRRRLLGHIQVLLAQKQFIGCQGLAMSEEIRVAIAANAALLLLHSRPTYFPKLKTILVYPGAYWVTDQQASGYVVEEQRIARLGESWSRDQLILTWDAVQSDAQAWDDGHNVVLHEFAHQLDQEEGPTQGVPLLRTKADYGAWAKVMTREFQQLRQDLERDEASRSRSTVIHPYGATNPAEFFAVATETFFERPQALQQRHRELYQLLLELYQVDPLIWH